VLQVTDVRRAGEDSEVVQVSCSGSLTLPARACAQPPPGSLVEATPVVMNYITSLPQQPFDASEETSLQGNTAQLPGIIPLNGIARNLKWPMSSNCCRVCEDSTAARAAYLITYAAQMDGLPSRSLFPCGKGS
jgi:hypothetical protein